jgi:hypothetical protein
MALSSLDEATTKVARALAGAFTEEPWDGLRYCSRWTPAGDVGADDFWITVQGIERQTLPDLAASLRVSDAAKAHWQLTQKLGQARWYKMTLTVERTGKFNVAFEYKDDYKEGDIMKSA